MMNDSIEDAICNHVCQREPTNPATYFELVQVAATREPLITSGEIDDILEAMVNSGQLKAFEDEERGTIYVRDC